MLLFSYRLLLSEAVYRGPQVVGFVGFAGRVVELMLAAR